MGLIGSRHAGSHVCRAVRPAAVQPVLAGLQSRAPGAPGTSQPHPLRGASQEKRIGIECPRTRVRLPRDEALTRSEYV